MIASDMTKFYCPPIYPGPKEGPWLIIHKLVTYLRAHALKPENLSKKSVVIKRKNSFTKTFSLFFFFPMFPCSWDKRIENAHTHTHTKFSQDRPGMFGAFFFPKRNDLKKTHKQQFPTHPIPGQSRRYVDVFIFVFSLPAGWVVLKARSLKTVTSLNKES